MNLRMRTLGPPIGLSIQVWGLVAAATGLSAIDTARGADRPLCQADAPVAGSDGHPWPVNARGARMEP